MPPFLRYTIATLLGLAVLSEMVSRPAGAAGPTLDRVMEQGELRCGVTGEDTGLSALNAAGQWTGFFPDFCRAVAAAVTGEAEAVHYVEFTNANRFDGLRSGAVDVLMATTTWTLQRDVDLGLSFTNIYYYTGQGFLGHRSLGANRVQTIERGTVCVIANTTSESNLRDYIAQNGLHLTPVTYLTAPGMTDAFFARQCDLLTDDVISVAGQRAFRAVHPEDYILFADVISKEPLGPVVRADDRAWFNVVRWVVLATIVAEYHGITSANIDTATDRTDPESRRLRGIEPGAGTPLGLDDAWAYRVVRQVGNYGEIFNRHLGPGTPLGLDRGINALWTEGGLLFAPPLR